MQKQAHGPGHNPSSLTREEAGERAAIVQVVRYDVEVDLRGLLTGTVWAATSTTTFRVRGEAVVDTFVDCAAEVETATLDDEPLEADAILGDRIALTGLEPGREHVLVVSSRQPDTSSANAVLRTVDPADGLIYVWSSFEPDGARRAWACFDQPDLKAPHRFTVLAPESWLVTSNGAPERVEPLEAPSPAGPDAPDAPVEDAAPEPHPGPARRWVFPDTPPLSTYVVVVNAGPFHEVREQRGGHSLGLFCRRSLARYLDRDAEELLRVTEQGLAFFGERFAAPFPQERYDQVFVPGMGGAMENWGCVTWTDSVLWRSPPSHAQRAGVARVLLHEMAHMWFGDLVTMRWWDDLWLNEAFASWAATWAAAAATAYVDDHATFAVAQQLRGYAMDMSPATHPIRGEVPDVRQATANFDAITYVKGQSVLGQLAAFVGEDAFVAGLRRYFADHAWGNTVLDDLVGAVAHASGRDLAGWTADWLDRPGTDTISLVDTTLLTVAPDRPRPRPHRFDIGCYLVEDDALRLVERLDVEVSGIATPLRDRLPDADLYLLDESGRTFASMRTDETSLEVMLGSAAALPSARSRATVVATAWDMLARGELSTGDLLALVIDLAGQETSPALVEPFLDLALTASTAWTPTPLVSGRLGRLGAVAHRLARTPEHRLPALRTLAACALTDDQFDLLDAESRDDVDLAWRTLVRRAALGRYDERTVAALLTRDPDPDAWVRALGVRGARPSDAAKEEVWGAVFHERTVGAGLTLSALWECFWQPEQRALLEPWTLRWLEEVQGLDGGGLLSSGGLLRATAPPTAEEDVIDAAREVATRPDARPALRTELLVAADRLARSLRARS